MNNRFKRNREKKEKTAKGKSFLPLYAGLPEPPAGLERLRNEAFLDRHLHLHAHEMISRHWLGPGDNPHPRPFPRFVWVLLGGMGMIGFLWFQGWR